MFVIFNIFKDLRMFFFVISKIFDFQYFRMYTYTHTHTYIYIFIYTEPTRV